MIVSVRRAGERDGFYEESRGKSLSVRKSRESDCICEEDWRD